MEVEIHDFSDRRYILEPDVDGKATVDVIYYVNCKKCTASNLPAASMYLQQLANPLLVHLRPIRVWNCSGSICSA